MSGDLPDGWRDALPTFPEDAKGMATRKASGATLDALAAVIPDLVGGSADLTPSNNTLAKGMTSMEATTPGGDYVHYGVREFGMAAVMNGMSLHGGVRPYGGTFLIFSDYAKAAVRLAASCTRRPCSCLPTIRSGWARTARRTSRSSSSPACAPSRTCSSCARPTPTRRPRPGPSPLEQTDRPTAFALSRQGLPTLAGTVGAAAGA